MIYLDHNATSPVRPEAAAVVARALAETGNASSVHAFGRCARMAVEDAREAVAALVGARAEGVVFTSGGTEANNLALRGAGRELALVSAVEHPSVLGAFANAETVPVDGDGVADLDALAARLDGHSDGRLAIVSLMLANNETGVVQPVARAAEMVRSKGALVHCDAVQAAGRIPVDMAALGVHMLTVSAHKLGGPPGVGALVLADGVEIEPLLFGGGQERRRRAGTENVPAIAGFGVAAAIAVQGLEDYQGVRALRDAFERRVTTTVPGATVFGAKADRLPNTSCIAMPGVAADIQVMAFDLDGFAVSSGAACSSGKVERSHVLSAMGVADSAARTAIRVSLGHATQANEIESFADAWLKLHARLGADRLAA